ncbi:alpha/beta hydrolase fold domain-containing protein [candidate division KSB1 bacterium]|nr:alpha/beta hydrolase fold domain-containing protein [candidate division KSB1 bacterium]
MRKFFATAFLFCAGLACGQAGNTVQRYQDEVFKTVEVTRDIPYGEAVNLGTGKKEILLLDLYQPKGDAELRRPVVIWIHGGGFRGVKDKSNSFFVTLAERFAKRGYVTASIEYRLYGSITPDAIRQAYEDAKAAVRWFRANAKTFRIDTTRIAVGGKSAGGITSLFATYAEPEGNSGSPGHSSAVSACIEMAGMMAVSEMEPGEPPVLIIHGTDDKSVPYASAGAIKNRAEQVGIPYDFRPVPGGDHDLSDHMEELVQWSSDFLYKYVIQGAPAHVDERAELQPNAFQLLQNYPNPFSASHALALGRAPSTKIRYTVATAGEVSLQVFNALGQEIQTLARGPHEPGAYTREFVASGLPAGLYFFRLQAGNAVFLRKMILAK